MTRGHFTIGQAASANAVSAKAIRHYESMDLLPAVPRKGSYRFYDNTHVQAIKLIRQAQSLGFTLAELRALGKDDCTPDWPRFVQAITFKRQQLAQEIKRLQWRDHALAALELALPDLLGQQGNCEDFPAELIAP